MVGHAYDPDQGCTCVNCKKEAKRRAREGGNRSGSFSRKLPDGTTIYGPTSTEGRPGHYHGHRGGDFDRSPHSTIGSAAIGDPHTYEEHKNKRTKRW